MQVAILFLCEIDNITYSVGLSERARSQVEELGRVELGDGEASALVRSKLVHAALVVAAVLTAVGFEHEPDGRFTCVNAFPFFLAFWAGGVAAAFAPGVAPVQVCKDVGKAVASCLLGFSGFAFFGLVVNMGLA